MAGPRSSPCPRRSGFIPFSAFGPSILERVLTRAVERASASTPAGSVGCNFCHSHPEVGLRVFLNFADSRRAASLLNIARKRPRLFAMARVRQTTLPSSRRTVPAEHETASLIALGKRGTADDRSSYAGRFRWCSSCPRTTSA